MEPGNWWARLISEDRTEEELTKSHYVVYIERLFKIRQRKTTISREIKCGLYHFFSCSFILSVNPTLMQGAGFDINKVAVATALVAGVSSIFSGLLSNLPIVLSPTTSTSLYFSLYMQNRALSVAQGNLAVFLLGILFIICGQREIARFISNNIPFVIKVGICLGVGLLIALEALTEIGLVQKGDSTVLGTLIYTHTHSYTLIYTHIHSYTLNHYHFSNFTGLQQYIDLPLTSETNRFNYHP